MDIQLIYEQAGKLHGHYCPGLAIGVRAAFEAKTAIDSQMQDRHNRLQCLAESPACWLDGIQYVLGATVGNGALKIVDMGKSAFSFYNPETGESLRLFLLELPRELPKSQLIQHILSAPAEKIFRKGPVRRPFPERGEKAGEALCCRCGESLREDKAQFVAGQPVCMDCL